MKLGLEWNYALDVSADEQARSIKENGFDATFVARQENLDEVMTALRKYGIECESYHAPFNGINDIWVAGEDGERMLSRLCSCIDSCAQYNIPVVVVHLSSGMTPPRMSDIGFERCDRLIAYAEKNGVTVAFENIRKLDNLAFAMENYPSAGLCWDVGHEACYMSGVEIMSLWGNRIAALHLHDNTAEYDADNHWLPYEGVIDMEKAARHLAKSRYQGSIMLEVKHQDAKMADKENFYVKAYEAAKRFSEAVEKYGNF